MAYFRTTATRKIMAMKKRIRIVQGGSSASKTISILLYLIALAQSDKKKTLTSVCSESIPHLKRGAIRDFKNIMQDHGYWKDENWQATDSIYTFETGSQIEFFSTDNGDKLRGARRDRLFINECNNVTFEAFDQLEMRTNEFVYLDYNPSNEFWVFSDVCKCGMSSCKGTRTDTEHLIITYRDNEALSPNIVQSLEQRRARKGWWQVYGMGLLGEVEGKIYRDWAYVDSVPHEAKLVRCGIDFGYTNDPTAIVFIYKYNNSFILDEISFKKGLSNKQIADIVLSQEKEVLCIADCAEPKSIDEISSYGVTIIKAEKGRDSIVNGIQIVQNQRISMTKRSINIIKEYRNYLWMTDKNGKVLNVPESGFDHSMDAIRYAISNIVKNDIGDTEEERAERLLSRLKNLPNKTR